MVRARDHVIFLFLLFSSIFGEVVLFHYKIDFNLPKVGIILAILYFFTFYFSSIIEFLKKDRVLSFFLVTIFLWALITFYLGNSNIRIKAFPFALRYLVFPFMIISMIFYLKKAKDTGWILLYWFMFFLAIGGVAQLFFGKEILPLLKLSHPHPTSGWIVYSLLYNQNIFGNTMNFFFWLNVYLLVMGRINKYLFIINFFLSIFTIFISGSKGTIFSFLTIGLIIAIWFWCINKNDINNTRANKIIKNNKFKKRKIIIFIIYSIISILIIFFITIYNSSYFFIKLDKIYPGIRYLVKGDLSTLLQKHLLFKVNWDFSGRRKIWKEGWKLFKTHPIVGIGPGFYRFLSKVRAHHMHNIFYTILVEQGIVGFIIWFSFYVYIIIIGFRKMHFSVFFVLIILLSQMFGYFFDHSYFYFVLTSFTIASVFIYNE